MFNLQQKKITKNILCDFSAILCDFVIVGHKKSSCNLKNQFNKITKKRFKHQYFNNTSQINDFFIFLLLITKSSRKLSLRLFYVLKKSQKVAENLVYVKFILSFCDKNVIKKRCFY